MRKWLKNPPTKVCLFPRVKWKDTEGTAILLCGEDGEMQVAQARVLALANSCLFQIRHEARFAETIRKMLMHNSTPQILIETLLLMMTKSCIQRRRLNHLKCKPKLKFTMKIQNMKKSRIKTCIKFGFLKDSNNVHTFLFRNISYKLDRVFFYLKLCWKYPSQIQTNNK